MIEVFNVADLEMKKRILQIIAFSSPQTRNFYDFKIVFKDFYDRDFVGI
jgi:hypothetical protein